MLKVQKIAFSFVILASLAACSPKISGGSSDAAAPAVHGLSEADQVAGPALDGVWASECVRDFDDSKKITMVIKGKHFSRTTEKFSNRYCDGVSTTRTSTGTFVYQKSYAKNVYELDYHFDLGNGVTIYSENVRRDGKVLWISEFSSGDGVEPRTALNWIGEAK